MITFSIKKVWVLSKVLVVMLKTLKLVIESLSVHLLLVENVNVSDSNSFHISMFHVDCKTGMFSLCDITNDSKVMETFYGHRICGAFGYSHLTGKTQKIRIHKSNVLFLIVGGYDGCQAEWVRVPFADVNLLKIENDRLTDEQVLFLSDIVCTG